MAIYVKFERQRTVKQFLTLLYSHYNNSGYVTAVETYCNKECTLLQCVKNKYRSIDEVLELVKTYYPSFTLKKLAKLLHSIVIINGNHTKKEFYFNSLYCNKVEKTTTLFTSFKSTHSCAKKGNSIMSAKEFYELSKT